MQVKDQTVIGRKKYAVLATILKVAITLACLYFLWDQFQKEEINFGSVALIRDVKWAIVLVTLLMIINWYLEALRWKISLASFEKISIEEAWSSVLGGLALNWILPFTGGDFAARLMLRKDKYQTTSAIVLNRSILLIITFGFGLFSLSYLKQSFFQVNSVYLILLLVSLAVVYFIRKRLSKFLTYFETIKRSVLVRILSISVLRYAIFTFQFYWLLIVFNPELEPILVLAGIGWIFFVRSIIPHLLGGVGLREAASVIFFTPYVVDLSTIVLPVFLIWIINTTIPSIGGLLFIWKVGCSSFSTNRVS